MHNKTKTITQFSEDALNPKAGFRSPIVLEVIEANSKDTTWMVSDCLIYHSMLTDTTYYIPEGFITNLASIPRLFYWLFRPSGDMLEASVLHDYLYDCVSNYDLSRSTADAIFYEAMLSTKTPVWKAVLGYRVVRLFGSGSFRRAPSES